MGFCVANTFAPKKQIDLQVFYVAMKDNMQLLDEAEHDIKNYCCRLAFNSSTCLIIGFIDKTLPEQFNS